MVMSKNLCSARYIILYHNLCNVAGLPRSFLNHTHLALQEKSLSHLKTFNICLFKKKKKVLSQQKDYFKPPFLVSFRKEPSNKQGSLASTKLRPRLCIKLIFSNLVQISHSFSSW